MSAPLGFFSDNQRDFPDLNKCPDCETFFADLYCPLCGKECPEEMRAGNRKPLKVKKRRATGNNSGRVQFVPWYFSTWFIIIMLFTMPIVGLILLWLGYWKKSWKIIVTVLLVVANVILPIVSAVLVHWMVFKNGVDDIPVDLTLSKAEYINACPESTAEEIYRNAVQKEGEFVNLTLKIKGIWENEDEYVSNIYYECYIEENEKTWQFLVRDWRQEDLTNLTVGDVITVYGQVGGNKTISNYTAGTLSAPCINMLYLDLK